MFTNFSHELRTPLTLIIAPLTDLLHKEDMPLAYRQSLELINRNSQRLLWLVNRLMDFHKLEAGKMQLHVSNYNLGTYIPEIINYLCLLPKRKTYLSNLMIVLPQLISGLTLFYWKRFSLT